MPEARIFTSRDFDRFARKARLRDVALVSAIESLEEGAEDAKLGANLFKRRIARQGEGKSGGYRTVIVFRKGDRAVFVEGFAKNDKKVHAPEELRALRAAANRLLSFSNAHILELIAAGELRRSNDDEETEDGSGKIGVFILDVPGGARPDDEEAVNASTGDTLATVHRLISGFYEAGVVDKATMRQFDAMCLTPVGPMDAKAIRELREASGVSQAVLAKVLNVTTNAVGQWERGEKRPTGSALKLLALLRAKGLAAVL